MKFLIPIIILVLMLAFIFYYNYYNYRNFKNYQDWFLKHKVKILITIIILGAVLFLIYNFIFPEINVKTNIIGTKRYTKHVSDLSPLKDSDLLKIKETVKNYRK